MTPQPRHIEAAEKIMYAFMDDPHKVSIRGDLTPMVALALAEAENRAAWDGWDLGILAKCTGDMWISVDIEKNYGQRPTTENQP